MHHKGIVGLTSGIAMVVATLVGVALVNPPRADAAAVVQGALGPCPIAEVAVDSGYGVSTKALRPICAAR